MLVSTNMQYNIYKTIREAGGHLQPRSKEYVLHDNKKLCRCKSGYIIICDYDNCHNIAKGRYCSKHSKLTTKTENLKSTTEKISKSDLIFIVRHRKLEYTLGHLCSLNITKLLKILQNITPLEEDIIHKQQIKRDNYIGDIDYNAALYGVADSYSKSIKLDCLIDLKINYPISLNDEQQEILQRISDKKLFVSAGPGSGKTTSLVSVVSHLSKHNFKVLVLMYGVNVQEQFRRRLLAEKIKLYPKSKVQDPQGVYVLTFHKYAYHSRLHGEMFEFKDYDDSVLIAMNVSPNNSEKWDYVIIDEAQDLKECYYKLVETINTQHIIYMGDPRQQINVGSNIYSKILLKENLLKLHMNHRSSADIVNILNKFSSDNFCPDIDIQQKSIINNGCEVIVEYGSESEISVKYLLDYPPGHTYIISPVSTNKYGIDITTNEIRQLAYEQGRKIFVSESGRHIREDVDYITNSILVKGLEREQIILYGVSNTKMYVDFTVQEYNMKCLLYVAMSRAMKRLIIIIDNKKYVSPNMLDNCLNINIPSVAYNFKPIDTVTQISVTDLSEYNFNVDIEPYCKLPLLEFDRSSIEDCSGIYVEACLAKNLNVLSNRYTLSQGKIIYSYLENGSYIYQVSRGDLQLLIYLFEKINNSNTSDEYKYLQATYTSRIKKQWSVSETLKSLQFDLTYHTELLQKLLGDDIKHNMKNVYPVPIDRSEIIAGEIVGVYDFSSNNSIVEIKHAHMVNKYINQAGIYQYISRLPTYLFNTLSGNCDSIKMNMERFDHYVRSILVLRQAHISRIGSPIHLPKGIIIFLDTEFCNGSVYEIGMVVVDIDNTKILEVYQKTAYCEISDDKDDPFTALTGLKVTGIPDLYYDFQDFYNIINLYPKSTIVQWGGCDAALLKITYRHCVDLLPKYRLHMSLSDTKYLTSKHGYRLTDAVNTVFPPCFTWHAHRAFEDAIMTAGVYYALATER